MAGLDLSGIAKLVEDLVLLDTVRFSRPGAGEPVFDQNTGEYVYPPDEVVYEGLGAVQVAGTPGEVSAVPVPNQPWVSETVSRYRALTPLSAPIAERDMLVSVVAVHPGGDPQLLGRQWRVTDPSVASTLMAVRISSLDQVQQPQETA
ncbi:DUF6093 family protein [Streptomyces hygroscopicus]|uniref:Uncharacterized protein n=1 Tax=Streptomyces hygroscopicus TaxID=1912 RepID=A0ABQ3UFK7_STRHY|nr:DUF6093 family protein [Streptomyces hygroscopicus]GHJ34347.1 hypothetical protein TPA0910_87800 [Streptomyces hygroscopicus]GHJ34362.1 hypothetical protein TPA0910_87950 [Streptomyces hygroscopicus]